MRSSAALGGLSPGWLLSARGEHGRERPLSGAGARDTPTLKPDDACAQLDFSAKLLRDVRRLVAEQATLACLSEHRREDLVLAIDELATNSVTHGGGSGTLRIWREERAIACEVCDAGHIEDPLAGRRPPRPEQVDGRGLWIVSRLCDHVQISSAPGRTAVRVQMATR